MIKPFNLKLKRREKIFVFTGCLIALFIISYRVLLWADSVRSATEDKASSMIMLLERQANMIAGKEDIEKRLETAKKEIINHEKKLLASDRPAIAAAELQKTINDIAMPLNIQINSQKILSSIDQEMYIAIPVEIRFVSSTSVLKDILTRLKASKLLLSVSKIKIRVMNVRNPKGISVTMTVTGFAKKESRKT